MVVTVVKPSAIIKALWFSIGGGAAYAGYYAVHKELWAGAKQVAQGHGTLPAHAPQQDTPELLFGPAARATVAKQWNKLVDDTLGRLAKELGRRGI